MAEREISEELVEEIYKKAADFFGRLVVYPEIRLSEDDRRSFVMGLIARIAKAIADGEIKLPDEAWRAQAWIERGRDDYYKNLQQTLRVEVRPPIGALENIPEGWAFDVIALREEVEK